MTFGVFCVIVLVYCLNIHHERMNIMKKAARLMSAVALTLTIIICFSGCGLAEFTRSLITSDTDDVTANIQAGDTTLQYKPNNSVNATENAIAGTTQPSTQAPTQGQTQKPSKVPNTQQAATENTDSQTPETTKKPNTGVKEEPIKDIQDLLFATDPNKASQILETAGFAYDEAQGIYYTPLYPWQRNFGYNVGFDMAAPIAGMVFDTIRIEFLYDEREWMVQIWKGQYGITAGAEIGLYNRDPSKVMQYDCADDEDLIEMQFDFYNQGQYVFSRGPEKHWWLTGFKIFHMGIPFTITMDMTLKFTDNAMATAFLQSLKKQQMNSIMNPIKYKRAGSTIRILWGSQPAGMDF